MTVVELALLLLSVDLAADLVETLRRGHMGKLQKLAGAVSSLGAAGAVVAGLLVFGEDGRLQQVKLGPLAVFDRRRWDARRARRAERRAGK